MAFSLKVMKQEKILNLNWIISNKYSRLRNKRRGMLINFWTFFQGLHSLLERVMPIFFKISTILWYGDAYFKGYAQ